jgi:membrane protein DedA with SNARE-associated domain
MTKNETNDAPVTIKDLTWWELLLVPIFAAALIYGLTHLLPLLGLPNDKEALIAILRGYIQTYGFAVSIMGAFLEGLLLIGWYFPGSFIIFLTVILAGNIPDTIEAVCVVTLGMYSAYVVNYLLGKYGWYRVLAQFGMEPAVADARKKIERYGTRAIFMTFWNPGLASFTSTAAGIITYPYIRFLVEALIALLVWNTMWGTIAYFIGMRVLNLLFNWYMIGAILAGWYAMQLYERWKDARAS